MAPPLLKRQKSALRNKSFQSEHAPPTQALVQPSLVETRMLHNPRPVPISVTGLKV